MSDKAAVAAAKEIWREADLFDKSTEQGVPELAAIISKHYAPRLEAAEKMEHALDCVWAGVSDRVRLTLDDYSTDTYTIVTPVLVGALKKIRAALSAWKASQ